MKQKSFKERIIEVVSYKDTSVRALKQDILLKTFTCVLLALVSGVLTLLNISKHFSFMTLTTMALTVGMIVAAILCGVYKKTDAATIIVAILGMVVFTDYAIRGENEGFAILWITMVPLICMMWMGVKIGFLVSLYFQILLIVLFYTGLRESMNVHYSDIFMTRFPILYLGTFAVSSWIFYQKQKSQMMSDNSGRLDALTNVDNRLGLDLKLSSIFGEGVVPKMHVIVFDINRLKYINDKYGHKTGDEIIIAASDYIREAFSDYTIFARVGGDEFYWISTKESIDFEAGKNRLNELSEEWKKEDDLFLSISCGYVCGENVIEEDYASLIHKADQEMYTDKSRFYKENSIDRRSR